MGVARCVRPTELVAAAIDHIALEGSNGVAVPDLMDAIEGTRDARMRRQVWLLLRRQHASGVLQFYYVVTPTNGDLYLQNATVNSAGKKRKRPTGGVSHTKDESCAPNGSCAEKQSDDSESQVNGAEGDETRESESAMEMEDDRCTTTEVAATTAAATTKTQPTTTAKPIATQNDDKDPPLALVSVLRREPIADASQIAFEDACPLTTRTTPQRHKRLFVVACEELRLRALNIPKKAILAEFGDDHVRILEAVGRTRARGITIPELCDVFGNASSVKKVHNSLDTLISYNLVIKRMMIVTRPSMRRLNIVHLPRFAAAFVPTMYDDSAEFESDEQCKKLLMAAAETYLTELPTRSAVLYDLGRDLGFQKRHLEVLKNHIMQECKRDEHFHLELFQAVLQPPKKGGTNGNKIEPKILNCVRYRTASETHRALQSRGMSLELGLLHQIYGVIEENGDSGTTIIDLRNHMVLPGNKLPYKLVSILAGTYGLKAEAIILGKNKAFKLYPMLSDPKGAGAAAAAAAAMKKTKRNPIKLEESRGHDDPNDDNVGGDDEDDCVEEEEEEEEEEDITVISASSLIQNQNQNRVSPARNDARYKRVVATGVADQKEEMFSVRANLALKVALGGIEVEGTRQRRRDHITKRLLNEKLISLSSLRASMFLMEKQHAASDAAFAAACENGMVSTSSSNPHVGMVDTRSVSRIAAELESEGTLRQLQLPLPPRNVSTKFRALRCVVLPGFEHDELFIQEWVKNYAREERLRRIQQNAEKNEVVRLRAIDSDDENVPGFTLFQSSRKRPRVENGDNSVASTTSAVAAVGTVSVRATTSGAVSREPAEISYRVRRFVSQGKSSLHSQQYRRLGFAYGVMFRCKQFHEFLWRFLNDHPEIHLRDEEIDISVDDDDDEILGISNKNGIGEATTKTGSTVPETHATQQHRDQQQPLDEPRTRAAMARGVVFSRETVLHRMPVYLYILAFSGGSVLTPSEYALVEHAVKNRLGFDTLPPSVSAKVWAHESGRTAKVLGTLTDLNLIVPHKIGMKNLIKILRAGYTDDQDGILAQALKDNALGGLFRMRNAIRIVLDDREGGGGAGAGAAGAAGTPLRPSTPRAKASAYGSEDGVNAQSVIKLVGTTEKSFSFGSLLPLQHVFASETDVSRYWEVLEGLCLERMVMEVSNPKPNAPAVREVPLPFKSRARRMFRILGWIAKSQKPPTKTGEEIKTVKRTGIVSRSVRARRRRGPGVKKRIKTKKPRPAVATTTSATNGSSGGGEGGGGGSGGGHRMRRGSSYAFDGEDEDEDESGLFAWSEEDERQLVDLFIDNCRSRWKIPIPQGIQRDSESVAFRIPWLSRSGFGLVSIARKLAKRKIDVKKRLKEKLTEPDAKLLLEAAKREMVETLNPSGKFDEELAIFESPRLTALFRRAVMMIVSPQDEYHPLVAEELISFWTAEEIRLVWRYLWLKNWIVRATERERIRGYSTSQRLQDFLKFSTLTYPLELFRQAAEQETMVSSTIEEAGAGAEDTGADPVADATHQHDTCFEAEFPPNATPGQCALELGCQVMGLCSLVAVHAPIAEDAADMSDASGGASGDHKDDKEKTAVMLARKRTLRFLNYKSQKEGTGFAAHLSKRLCFKNPAILTENWHVETKMNAVALATPELRCRFEAFSTTTLTEEECRSTKRAKCKSSVPSAIADLVEQAVRNAGEHGASLEEIVAFVRSVPDQPLQDASVVKCCAADLVATGVLLTVNAYFAQRYIVKDHGDVWLLRSYSLVGATDEPTTTINTTPSTTTTTTSTTTTAAAAPLPRVVFEGEKDLLSFPWLKMDGSTNFRFLYSIQRKLLACVLLSPGVTEETVFKRMDHLLTLQDTREALALLVDDGLLYTRATATTSNCSGRRREPTLFGKKRSRPEPVVRLVSVTSRELPRVDRTQYVVHYFPHVECIQRFGSMIQDYQNQVADGPRG